MRWTMFVLIFLNWKSIAKGNVSGQQACNRKQCAEPTVMVARIRHQREVGYEYGGRGLKRRHWLSDVREAKVSDVTC